MVEIGANLTSLIRTADLGKSSAAVANLTLALGSAPVVERQGAVDLAVSSGARSRIRAFSVDTRELDNALGAVKVAQSAAKGVQDRLTELRALTEEAADTDIDSERLNEVKTQIGDLTKDIGTLISQADTSTANLLGTTSQADQGNLVTFDSSIASVDIGNLILEPDAASSDIDDVLAFGQSSVVSAASEGPEILVDTVTNFLQSFLAEFDDNLSASAQDAVGAAVNAEPDPFAELVTSSSGLTNVLDRADSIVDGAIVRLEAGQNAIVEQLAFTRDVENLFVTELGTPEEVVTADRAIQIAGQIGDQLAQEQSSIVNSGSQLLADLFAQDPTLQPATTSSEAPESEAEDAA